MELNYEKRYAYAEVDCILKWLGEEYINKIPNKIIQLIKAEKKIGYRPELDFTKPLSEQVRQETKNIIAYLNYNYWLTSQEEKKLIENAIKENSKKEKEKKTQERMKEIERKAQIMNQSTVSESIENALKKI